MGHHGIRVDRPADWYLCPARPGGIDEPQAPQGDHDIPQPVLHALYRPLRGGYLPVGRHAQPPDWLDQPFSPMDGGCQR